MCKGKEAKRRFEIWLAPQFTSPIWDTCQYHTISVEGWQNEFWKINQRVNAYAGKVLCPNTHPLHSIRPYQYLCVKVLLGCSVRDPAPGQAGRSGRGKPRCSPVEATRVPAISSFIEEKEEAYLKIKSHHHNNLWCWGTHHHRWCFDGDDWQFWGPEAVHTKHREAGRRRGTAVLPEPEPRRRKSGKNW